MMPLNISGGVNNLWVLGFSSDVSSSLAGITTAAEVSECTPSGVQSCSGSATVATSPDLRTGHFSISSRDLITDTSLKWFKCTGDTGTNAWENFQAMLIYYNPFGSTQIFTVFIKYTIEFCSPISTLLTAPCLRKPDSPIDTITDHENEIHPRQCKCSDCLPIKGRTYVFQKT
jgi:hypothetical protein